MLWDKIAADLRTQKINVTSMQCSNKWKSLKREYKKTSNFQTGEERKTCPFYSELIIYTVTKVELNHSMKWGHLTALKRI